MKRALRLTRLVLRGYTYHAAKIQDYLHHGADDKIFRALIMGTYNRVNLRDTIFILEHTRYRYQLLRHDVSYRLIALIYEFLKFGSLGIVAYIQSISHRLEEVLAWSQHPDCEKIKTMLRDIGELLRVRHAHILQASTPSTP